MWLQSSAKPNGSAITTARAPSTLRFPRRSPKRAAEYHGPYYDFSGFVVDPHARQARVPMWVGGRTARSLRRAVALGDGWAPFGLRTAELGKMLARARDTAPWTERATPIEVVL